MMSTNLLDRILATAKAFPELIAVKCHDGNFTYGELLSRASALAGELRRRYPERSRFAIVGHDDRLTYAGLLGIWLAGGAYVPINKANPVRRNVEIIADAMVSAVISSREFPPAREAADQSGCDWIPSAAEATGRDSNSSAPMTVSPGDLAYILFTSGSTGRPKGVPITHGNLSSFCDAWIDDDAYELSPDDRFLQMFDLGFDLSVMNIFVPWSMGASVHVVPHQGITYVSVYRTMAQDKITIAMMVPSVLSYLSSYFNELRLPDLRYSMFAGEALPQSLVESWSQCVPNALIQNAYGPTEATIFCHAYKWNPQTSATEAINDIVPIGWPLNSVGELVLDESGREIVNGDPGELCLYGPQVAEGYWRNPERTSAAFFTHIADGRDRACYRTGDIVSRNPNGSLSWRGRLDHQVKIDGHRIELSEIEAHAREISGSAAVAAVAITGMEGMTRIVLFMEGGHASRDLLHSELANRLPVYMRPQEVRTLEVMPLNINGKIDRKRLGELAKDAA